MSAKVVLKRGKAGPAIGRHPWLFSSAIDHLEGEARDGEEVQIFGEDDRFIGYGLWNSKSQIRARLYSFNQNLHLSAELFRSKIERAIQIRRDLFGFKFESDTACRLIFSEADFLSGLVVDRYGDYLSLQITSLGVAKRKDEIIKALVELCSPKGIYLRAEQNILKAEGLEMSSGILFGEVPDFVTIVENGLQMEVALKLGQKTGHFLDQRENRLAVSHFAKDRKVLDLYTYTGGFALHSARAGARSVIGVDSSHQAIEAARKNAALNHLNIDFKVMDVFEFLKNLDNDKFDMICIDPPRFSPTRNSKEKALRAYFSINEAALTALAPGGVFVSSSCSGHISREDFEATLSGVARRVKRDFRILAELGQALDHPISSACHESNYLKCFICVAD